MSGTKRTEDLQTLKTRSLVIQNPDKSFPPVGSVLATSDQYGRQALTLDISINSVDASRGVFNEVILGVDGVLKYQNGHLYVNADPITTSGYVGATGLQGPLGPTGLQGPIGPQGNTDIFGQPGRVTTIILPYRQYLTSSQDLWYGYSGTSAQILLYWTNPPQTNFSSFPAAVPTIAKLTVQVTDPSFNYTAVATDHLPGSSATNPIRGVLLVKGNGLSGYQYINPVGGPFYGQPGAAYPTTTGAYVFYLGPNSLIDRYMNTRFNVRLTYSGYNDISASYVDISGLNFNEGGSPTAPRSLLITDISYNSVRASYLAPTFVDGLYNWTTGQIGVPTIDHYTITSRPVSSIRYPRVYDTSLNITTAFDISATVTGLYPDTSYNIIVTATSSVAATGTPTAIYSVRTTEDEALRPPYVDSLSPDLGVYGASFPVADLYCAGVPVGAAPALRLSGSVMSLCTIGPLGIHIPANRGSSAPALMTIDVSFNNQSASLAVGGFGQPLASTSKIIEVGTADRGTGPTSGFYLDASFQLIPPRLTEPQTLQLSQTFTDASVRVSPSYTYFWDTLGAGLAPTLTMTAVPVTTAVCGLAMNGSPSVLNVSASLANMGSNLHVAAPLFYSFLDASGVAVSSLPSPIPSTVNFQISADTGLPYSLGGTLSLTATNINGLTATVTSACNFIVDPASVALVTLTSPASTPFLGSTGRRFTSPTTLSTSAASLSAFNNAPLLTTFFESLPYQGAFYMKGNTNAFANYAVPPINGPNYAALSTSYTSITGSYQYTTFVWRDSAGNNARGSLTLQIEFTVPMSFTGGVNNLMTLKSAGSTDGRYDVYYQMTPTDTTVTSAWINANSNVGRANFTTLSKTLGSVVGGFAAGALDQTGTIMTYTVLLPTPYVSSGTTIAVTVGLPRDSTTGIKSVVCASA
jgi:hypothetical protein